MVYNFNASDLSVPHFEAKHKKKRIFRKEAGSFLRVRCNNCEETNITYSHSQSDIKCKGCYIPIMKCTGGRAVILNGSTFKKIDNRFY
ncbi:RS271 [Hepatospora eriocheir]|uniref:RS271 n=1 Tax=Hepatospora eriocheir TaxID=1081669 RepID=A0A1X0Q8T0_9MICR|nr:RS271 [Hepatospora eriocheir]